MALITEDVVILVGDDWTLVPVVNTVMYVTEVRDNDIVYRFGETSTSHGSVLKVGEAMAVEENIYVKVARPENASRNNGTAVLTITRD